MKKKLFSCEECAAVFRIGYEMDSDRYQVAHCPFCGTELDTLDPDNGYEVEEISDE